MGVQITELLIKHQIRIDDLKGKILAVDAFNILYQFLATIRQRDGTPLKDSKGNITSHLTGLFSRTTKLMEEGIKLCFIFDGKPPELKKHEQERRAKLKIEAEFKHRKAVEKEDINEMYKYSQRIIKLNDSMIQESKELLEALGLPVIQAPSEGEAQAAFMAKHKDIFAIVSQDIDSLMFGAPRLLRNLSISTRRKIPSGAAYQKIEPELILLDENLKNLGINLDQLIALCMLVGTDFNPGGIKGIGPKNAMKLVKQFGEDFESLFEYVKWNKFFNYSWKEVFEVIKDMPTTENFKLEWKAINADKIKEILVERHDFSEERVNSTLEKLNKTIKDKQQKGLGEYF